MTTHRGLVTARNGVVCTADPLAAQAGLRALQDGGNCIDAALAAAAVLNVAEPGNSHLGGDCFLLFYEAASGKVHALNGSGAAPAAATPEAFPDGIPSRHLTAAAVPGEVDAWFTALARWGTMEPARILAPAIEYADGGLPVSTRLAHSLASHAPLFADRPAWAAAFLPNGRPPAVGEMLRQPDLARSLRLLATQGRDAFYYGEIGQRIADHCRAAGGFIREADLRAHASEIKPPISITYRGFTVYEQPPVSQGVILLEELNLVEGFAPAEIGTQTAAGIHRMVEAKKLAFADRLAVLGDPRAVSVPLDDLLSKDRARRRAAAIDPDRAADPPPPAAAWLTAGTDTTYLCAADRHGNAVSFIQSLYAHMGCGELVPGTGLLLNNRMTGFSLDPNSPNFLVPGKRPVHTLNTFLVLDERAGRARPVLIGGTPGGHVQVQTNLQSITHILDGGLNPQQAAEAPKWQHAQETNVLAVEERVPAEVVAELQRLGHRVVVNGPWSHPSAVQLIRVHPESGAYLAGSDPRCDGCAAGW